MVESYRHRRRLAGRLSCIPAASSQEASYKQCSPPCDGVAASLLPCPLLRASLRWVMCIKDITTSPMAKDWAVTPRRYDVKAYMHYFYDASVSVWTVEHQCNHRSLDKRRWSFSCQRVPEPQLYNSFQKFSAHCPWPPLSPLSRCHHSPEGRVSATPHLA